MKKYVPLFLFIIFIFQGCSPEVTTVQVVRNPLIKFDFGNGNTWKSSSYDIFNTSRVVVYPQDTSKPGQLYNRFNLQASAKDDKGNDYQLTISFDSNEPDVLVGTYTPSYTTQHGLAQVQLYNLTNTNSLVAYNLCKPQVAQAIFQVTKQHPEEKLISGSFQMTLCNARDTTQKIIIRNGIFTDLRY